MSSQSRLTDQRDPGRTHCILVVEDEVVVRMAVAAYLRECGFQVIEAKTADEAVTVLAAGTEVDIVFSDIQMPGRLDGFALSHWLRRERPDIKVLLTSGIARTALAAGESCVHENGLLPKPYEHTELLRRITRLMDKG